MNVGYVRVSTVEQNEARQIEALKNYNIDKYFTEKVSAKDMKRPKLNELLDFVREGDTVYILDFSRLARSTSDLLKIIDLLKEKKVELVSIKENVDTTTPAGTLMITMIGAINQFERANLLERQKEGIAIAKREGKYKGGVDKKIDNFEEAYKRYLSREISKTKLAEILKISRPTLDKLINRYEKGEI